MKTALILAYECAPHNRPASTIGAQRPLQFARHLPSYNWRSIVLCCDFASRYSLDESGPWHDSVRKIVNDDIAVLALSATTVIIPMPSLKYANRVDRMWKDAVEVNPQSGAFKPRKGLLTSLRSRLATLIKLFRGDHSESWQPVATLAAEIICRQFKVDIIIAEHSPDAAVFVASKLSHEFKIPWIIDFRDPMLRDMRPVARYLYKLFTVPRFKGLSGTINVNNYWVELDHKLFGVEGATILNGFDPDDLPPSPVAQLGQELRIGYFGGLQRGQNLVPFIEALSKLPADAMVKFIYRGSSHSWVERELKKYQVPPSRYDCSPTVSRDQALTSMSTCDVLLLVSLQVDGDLYLWRGLYPGKTFEYFALRKPILLTVGDRGMLDELILEGKVGRIGVDAESMTQLLNEAVGQKQAGRAIWNVVYADDFIKRFTRHRQTGLLVDFMESLLGTIR